MTVTNPGGGSSTAAFAFGTAAARPAAAAAKNTGYYATDTGEVTFSDGTNWQSISSTANVSGFTASGGIFTSSGLGLQRNAGNGWVNVTGGHNLDLATAGQGIAIIEGPNCKQGVGTLVAGSLVVANNIVTATSRIFLTSNADGGTPGFLRVSARTAGTSFTVTSSSGADTSTFAYEIFDPG